MHSLAKNIPNVQAHLMFLKKLDYSPKNAALIKWTLLFKTKISFATANLSQQFIS
jgi:hypothetical protein